MNIKELDFDSLSRVDVALKWGGGQSATERSYYCDDIYFYKIWSAEYCAHKLEILGEKYSQYSFSRDGSPIAFFDCRLANDMIVPAFVDYIYDDNFNCLGYITKKGSKVDSVEHVSKEFVDALWLASVESGYFHSDFNVDNIIIVDGRFSLIDLDSPPSRIDCFDLDFQKKNGALRCFPEFIPYYQRLIRNYFGLCSGL